MLTTSDDGPPGKKRKRAPKVKTEAEETEVVDEEQEIEASEGKAGTGFVFTDGAQFHDFNDPFTYQYGSFPFGGA